jgi:hypothetical protein
MRSFLIAWTVAFALVAVLAGGVSWYVGRQPQPPTPIMPGQASRSEAEQPTSLVFTATEAIDVVAQRLPTDAAGQRDRRLLQTRAAVTYHSPQHWRVCFDGACWVAHGPGRYAEPENDAARQRDVGPRSPQ